MDVQLIEIGKNVPMSYDDFRNAIMLLFGRHGNIMIRPFTENVKDKEHSMSLFYVQIPLDRAKELFSEEDYEEYEDDDDLHVATWENGKGVIINYSMTRRLLIWAAHNYEKPQPCINCDIYKKNIKILGKDHWAMHRICQECICGKNGWPNFIMDIEE